MRIAACIVSALLLASLLSACAQPTRNEPAMTDDGGVDMPEKLKPCPVTPNCVCSEYPDDAHAVAPFSFDGDSERAWAALRSAVEGLPRTSVVATEADYLQAETKSALFRFVDDLEFRLDKTAGVIHVRSASRVGFSDLGANARRVEDLRERFAAALEDRAE